MVCDFVAMGGKPEHWWPTAWCWMALVPSTVQSLQSLQATQKILGEIVRENTLCSTAGLCRFPSHNLMNYFDVILTVHRR